MDIHVKSESGEEWLIGLATDELGHEICMGIRKGLFGVKAHDEESLSSAIIDAAEIVAEGMKALACALERGRGDE